MAAMEARECWVCCTGGVWVAATAVAVLLSVLAGRGWAQGARATLDYAVFPTEAKRVLAPEQHAFYFAWLATLADQAAGNATSEDVRDAAQQLAVRLRAAGPEEDPGDGERALLDLNSQAAQESFAGCRLIAWEVSPWGAVTPVDLPPPFLPFGAISAEMAANEYESAALMVANVSSEQAKVRVTIAPDAPPDAAAFGKDRVTVRRALWTMARDGKAGADALPLVGEEGIGLRPGEAAELWLTFQSRGLAAGRYRGLVQLSVGEETVMVVPVAVKVWAFALPEEMPLSVYNWAYVTVFPLLSAHQEEALADLKAHYTNTFVLTSREMPEAKFDAQGKLVGQIDFREHDRVLEAHSWAREVSWFWGFVDSESPDGGRFGAEWMSETWKKAFTRYLEAWVAHLQELGYGYGRFFFYPFDETVCPRFAELAALIKGIDPSIRVFADPTGGAKRKELEAIAPYIDVWCPHLESFVEERADDLQYLRGGGGRMWTYSCSGPAKGLEPYDYYRLKAWRAWQQNLAGIGFWAYGDAGWSGDNAWDDFDGGHCDYAAVYDAEHAPPEAPRSEWLIPSKRWEAWREGIEDYAYLHLLQRRLAACERAGIAREALAAHYRELERAAGEVLASKEDPRVLSLTRGKLGRCIESLPKIGE